MKFGYIYLLSDSNKKNTPLQSTLFSKPRNPHIRHLIKQSKFNKQKPKFSVRQSAVDSRHFTFHILTKKSGRHPLSDAARTA